MNHLNMPTDTVLLGVVDASTANGGLGVVGIAPSAASSPYLADEDATTCLLLPATPSPPPMDFIHPLAPGMNMMGGGDADNPTGADNNNAAGDNNSGNGGDAIAEETHGGDTSSTSGSSGIGMDVPIAGTTTLYNNKNVYQNLDNNGETFQQNGAKLYANLNIQITKDTPGFVHWNWPLIRSCSFWAFMAACAAMFIGVVAMIMALPRTCDPKTTWYNGGVFYEIFPASYQDFNGDGVGDLLGLTTRVGYMKTLGVSAVRLNSIFAAPHYPDNYANVSSLMHIDAVLGGNRELTILADALHARNMSLVLDLPLYPLFECLPPIHEVELDDGATGYGGAATTMAAKKTAAAPDNGRIDDDDVGTVAAARLKRELNETTTQTAAALTSSTNMANANSPIVHAMQLWLSLGVDGFYVQGLEHYASEPQLLLAHLRQWKRVLGADRAIIVSQRLLEVIAADAADGTEVAALCSELRRHVDLIDVQLDVHHDAHRLADQIRGHLANGPRRQLYWTLRSGNAEQESTTTSSSTSTTAAVGGGHRRRIASQHSPNATLAATMMALMLPGTPSILYGDEIGLGEAHDPLGDHADTRAMHHLAPMAWSTEQQFTARQTLPWMPAAAASSLGPRALSANIDTLAGLVTLRRQSPTLYQSGIVPKGPAAAAETTAVRPPEPLSNTAIRHSKKDVLIVERWYPRRQSFVSVTNLGAKRVGLDLSALFYGGVVVAGTGSGDRVLFGEFMIGPEETVVVRLDK